MESKGKVGIAIITMIFNCHNFEIDFRLKLSLMGKPLIDSKEFFANRSISELAKMQGVKPVKYPSSLTLEWLADEDVDEFLEMIYKDRRTSTVQSCE